MVDTKTHNKQVSLNEFGPFSADELSVRKEVSKFLFKMWENEKSLTAESFSPEEQAKLPLNIVLLEYNHLVRTHGLMSFLTSLGLPDQLWQAGYCLWLKADTAIRAYIGAKEELAAELGQHSGGNKLSGYMVDILVNMKNIHKELMALHVLPEESDFIDIMRSFKEFCEPDILALLIDQELAIEHYGALRKELVAALKDNGAELSAEQVELIDELILSQKALEASGLSINKSRDIGELVSHLKSSSPLISGLKSHLLLAHNIDEIELKSSDLVEEKSKNISRVSYSFLNFVEERKEHKVAGGPLRMIAAIAIFGLLSLGVGLAISNHGDNTSFKLSTAAGVAQQEEMPDFSVEIDLNNLKVLAYSEEEE